MALKVETEIVKNLKCIMCEKDVESIAFPDEEDTVCEDCIDEYLRQVAEYVNKYVLTDKKE